jgi:hypothetical protein
MELINDIKLLLICRKYTQIDLNNGIYEMYGTCSDYNNENYIYPSFTVSSYTIDFGKTLIDCSCDLYYIRKRIINFSGIVILYRIIHYQMQFKREGEDGFKFGFRYF